MSENNRLFRLKSVMNKRRPKFKRENYFRLKRIQSSWRRAKGIDSKMRHKLKGKRKSPGTGYRNPSAVRGLHPVGKELIIISNLKELEAIDVETQVAQIRATVGSRKRINLINYAEDNEIHIVNPQIRTTDFDEDIDDETFEEIEEDEDLELLDDDSDEEDTDE